MGSALNKSKVDVVRMLKANGFELVRSNRNEVWKNPETGKRATLPVGTGTLRIAAVYNAYQAAGVPLRDKNNGVDEPDALDIEPQELPLNPEIVLGPVLHAEAREGINPVVYFYTAHDPLARDKEEGQPLAPDREISADEQVRIVRFANKHSVNAACKRFNVRKKSVNQWRSQFEFVERELMRNAQEAIVGPSPRWVSFSAEDASAFGCSLRNDAMRGKRETREAQVAKRCGALTPDVAQRIAYMASQGVPEASIARAYGIAHEEVQRALQGSTEPPEASAEELRAENDALRRENEELKRLLAEKS